jgi:hypothetical protein
MEDKKKQLKRNKFAEALPSFDAAMRQIASVPKEEIERREQAERDVKESAK